MRNRGAGWLRLIVLALLCCSPLCALAQINTAADEKDGCVRNLKIIYDAIQKYRIDHKDIPNWLSDLVPKYINDPNVLICPVCKRTGQIESGALADPAIPCTYLYEFCPIPLGKGDSPADPLKTRREWKRMQMGLVGSVVPIVRCRHHGKVLNLAFDGRIYESPPSWEDLLTNQISAADLRASHIFTGLTTPNAAAKSPYPPRDPSAGLNLINLSAYYDATLRESWHGTSNNDLSSLPSGLQTFDGVEYDVRGIVQLGGNSSASKRFPERVNGIKIGQKCAHLHFLHAAGFGSPADEGKQIGRYIVHFATNQMQLEIPIVYGRDVRDWHKLPGEKSDNRVAVAWTGSNPTSAAEHSNIRLFVTTWDNLAPGVEIESIDYVSSMGRAAPFLIAITAE